MSKLSSIFRGVYGVLKVSAPVAVAVIEAVDPAVAPLVGLIYNSILKADAVPGATGAVKKEIVMERADDAIAVLAGGLARDGRIIDTARVRTAVSGLTDSYVAFLKAYAEVHEAIAPVGAGTPVAGTIK